SLSLCEACIFGSVTLLDWIWSVSPTSEADRSPGWSLNNYLRSDGRYHRHQFSESLKCAAVRGDLTLMKWLMVHFSNGKADPTAIPIAAREAARAGHLHAVYLLAYYDDRDGENGHKKKRKVESGRSTTSSHHFEIVRWVDEKKGLKNLCTDRMEIIINEALLAGEIELAKALVPPGKILQDYREYNSQLQLVEDMLESGNYRGSYDSFSLRAIRTLAGNGRMVSIQKIDQQCSPFSVSGAIIWHEALQASCKSGEVAVVKWLLEHDMGREVMQSEGSKDLLVTAAEAGHVEVMQYLSE
ncbi:hypothetical protein PHYSODRAFT_534205, partial [Phytophthora sojae]